MSNRKLIDIPEALEPFRFSLQKSVLKSSIITPMIGQTTVFDSKFGGKAYQPINEEYPKDYAGNPMLLLAQINFSEVAMGDPFPTTGLLQFFIAQNFYSFTDKDMAFYPHKTYAVRYLPNFDQPHQELLKFEDADYKDFPITHESKLLFNAVYEPVGATDYRISEFLPQQIVKQPVTVDGLTFEDLYLQSNLGADHKIGGYPYFIHEDIRIDCVSLQKYDTLLLQIISDDEQRIMWGDTGVIKFFINREQLRQADFSNVFLHTEDYS